MLILAHIIFVLGTFGLGVYTGKKLAARESNQNLLEILRKKS